MKIVNLTALSALVLAAFGKANYCGETSQILGPDRPFTSDGSPASGAGWPEMYATVQQCADRCEALASCDGFHYYGVGDSSYMDCYLKTGVTSVYAHTDPARKAYGAKCSATNPTVDAETCQDTSGWSNNYGHDCAAYVSTGWCAAGAFVAGFEWTGQPGDGWQNGVCGMDCAEKYNYPGANCCACGKSTQAECAATTIGADMDGTDVADLLINEVTDTGADAACCNACSANAECEFWVRETGTGSRRCWLKKNYIRDSTTWADRRGAFSGDSATFCGADISPLNANDYSSAAAMQAAGWSLNLNNFNNDDPAFAPYLAPGYDVSNSFRGFVSSPPVGDVQYTMAVSGMVTLKYGRAYLYGDVRVFLNGVEIDRTTEIVKTIRIEVAAGDTIKLSEHDTSIIGIYNIKVCSTTAPPTAAPTAAPTSAPTTSAPTSAPTGAPTAASLAAALSSDDLSASVGFVIGQSGDTVYQCRNEGSTLLCFKNAAGARGEWSYVSDITEVDAVAPEAGDIITSDGTFTHDPAGIAFVPASNLVPGHMWPVECSCASA